MVNRTFALRLREQLSLHEAAYLVQDKILATYDDALALLKEGAMSGKLAALVVWLPGASQANGYVSASATLTTPADVDAWLAALLASVAAEKEHIDQQWAARELWTLIEAAQLFVPLNPLPWSLVGDDPDKVQRAILQSQHRELFLRLYGESKDAVDQGKLQCQSSRTGFVGNRRVRPRDYVAWTRSRSFSVPAEFEALDRIEETVSTPQPPVPVIPNEGDYLPLDYD